MSWLFSRVMVAAFSEAHSLDGEPSAQLSLMDTAHPFLLNDKMMDCSRFSRSGLTCEPLTADRGVELLTWFLAGFHVRTSAPPATETDSTANAQGFGERWPASFVRYDHDSRSWRTHQFSLLGGLTLYSETWPRWGWMRDGECWELPTLAPDISASESGLWPTPCARDYRGVFRTERGIQRRQESRRGIPLNEAVGGLLNPEWVEWLMGWPIGWTALSPLETDKYREWLQQHGAC
jgi:hypothetical protein